MVSRSDSSDPGLADGVYTIPFDSVTGEATGEPVLARSINSRINRRQNLPNSVSTRCGGNASLNINDFQTAKAQLEERRLVERAKAILMQGRKLSEPEAYNWLRKKAMNENRKLAQVVVDFLAQHDAQMPPADPTRKRP